MDLKKYIYGHCVSPISVMSYDAYHKAHVLQQYPCGKCLHCRNSHINEWTTRLYAQAKYSKHVYYITLDYAPFDVSTAVGQFLAAETAAQYHNINKNKNYGMQPILLRKNHLQDFFKRLRKNTGKKFQYFACGEYGTHAEGTGYGRPHFHAIIFSDVPFSKREFEIAWTLYGCEIGRVDFHDLVANGSLQELNSNSKLNAKFVFKYVCKYLQKESFDFEALATIDYHRAYFEAREKVLANPGELFPEYNPQNRYNREQAWQDYMREFSPFIVCSKRPSIGLAYFEQNYERFKTQDFKLFGLPKECTTFPFYYVRKIKERLFSFNAVGEESGAISSNSRVGAILDSLREIVNQRNSFVDDYFCTCTNQHQREEYLSHYYELTKFPANSLHMYDAEHDVMYQYVGYGYNLWKKYNNIGFVKVGYLDICDVIERVQPDWNKYFEEWLKPLHHRKVLTEADLEEKIISTYGSQSYDKEKAYQRFNEEVYSRYQVELAEIKKKKLLMQNSKIEF